MNTVNFPTLKSSDDDDSGSNWVSRTIGGIFVIIVASLINYKWGTDILIFDVFGAPFWKMPTADALQSLWFIPVWAVAINVFALGFQMWRGKRLPNKSPGEVMKLGVVVATLAGIFEELSFRWILFLSSIALYTLSNFLFCGIPEWLSLNLFVPLADYGTLKLMSDLLYHPEGWLVGAAILSTAAVFREGHSYQGFFGWVDSWFFAMVMFYILFAYGLPVCIIAHFTFNLVASATMAFAIMLTTDH